MVSHTDKKKGPYQSIRIFKNPILEACTHVHPIIPLLMWGPVSGYYFYKSFKYDNLSLLSGLGVILLAFFVWGTLEYILHRFVFHFPAKSALGKRFVFMFHGLHHDDPKDPTRLVMPPVPALLIMSVIYMLFQLLIPAQIFNLFFCFFIIFYLCYDYIHYATHHFPMTSRVGRYLRVYHLKHHHGEPHAKYGVSQPLWDYFFQTVGKKVKF